MTVYYADDAVTIHAGDCVVVLREMASASVDSVVTDPPYGLEFMGQEWDSFKPASARFRTREDGRTNPAAGKSTVTTPEAYIAGRPFQEWCGTWVAECLRVLKPGGYLLAFGGSRTWHRLVVAVEDAGFEIRDSIAWLHGQGFPKGAAFLKPAFEPVVVARKPLAGTVAENVARYGTGGLDIDGCRVNDRWPPNVVLDEKTAADLDRQTGQRRPGAATIARRSGIGFSGGSAGTAAGERVLHEGGSASAFFPVFRYASKARGSERLSVNSVRHPTVKPLGLMRWLVRLVTPSGGLVLDPFAGSGTTAEACALEGLRCAAIEREPDYLPLIKARLSKPMEIGFDFEEGLS
ncbi:site-specific DNA-methyltransferase [Nocardia sp. CC227C]|uniref:DNA-methyltransferase n=1 Tax=Nocardia sp. CC227C TaxID=3044562 RepID=UPI00278C01B6|nr:site-specific DNA-methyltransferase [Nocardia sp. CC227C]